MTLLLGSDEKNETYRRAVLELQNEIPNLSMFDADQLAVEVLREGINSGLVDESLDNNFYLFELQKVLRKKYNFSSFFLSKRRRNCPRCTPLMEHFPDAWKT